MSSNDQSAPAQNASGSASSSSAIAPSDQTGAASAPGQGPAPANVQGNAQNDQSDLIAGLQDVIDSLKAQLEAGRGLLEYETLRRQHAEVAAWQSSQLASVWMRDADRWRRRAMRAEDDELRWRRFARDGGGRGRR